MQTPFNFLLICFCCSFFFYPLFIKCRSEFYPQVLVDKENGIHVYLTIRNTSKSSKTSEDRPCDLLKDFLEESSFSRIELLFRLRFVQLSNNVAELEFDTYCLECFFFLAVIVIVTVPLGQANRISLIDHLINIFTDAGVSGLPCME